MNCPKCGRFMKLRVHYTNEHDDSWEEHWSCTGRHLIQEWRDSLIDMSLTRSQES